MPQDNLFEDSTDLQGWAKSAKVDDDPWHQASSQYSLG